ncbi:MAG: hypothetical protein K1X92_03210 [Bacteroidia bacterium]|nr:hypothetical protein [Bacteroidia bacterium]
MKKNFLFLSFIVVLSLSFTGCFKDKCKMKYTYLRYTPVYMSLETFRNSVKIEGPSDLKNPGKIYTSNNLLIVNEVAKGVHIFNNVNPANPVNLSFISIPGNYDMAVKDNLLYCDNSIDLVVFDISNPAAPLMVSRVENTFPHMTSFNGYFADPNQGVVVDWVKEQVTDEINECDGAIPMLWEMNQVPAGITFDNSQRTANAVPSGSNKGGSMQRFAIKDDILYVILPQELKVLTLSGNSATQTGSVPLEIMGREAQTIFPYKNLLFVGCNNGMMIFNNDQPGRPSYLSEISHVASCDPVVANDNYAFVSLNNDIDNPCEGYSNQVEIVNIQNPANPFTTRVYPMSLPKGIGLDENLFFVTDGKDGLKIYDANFPENLSEHKLAEFNGMKGYDVIPDNKNLIFVGRDGIAQYDYSNIGNIKLVSKIPVVQ